MSSILVIVLINTLCNQVSKYKDHIGDDSGDDIDADETEGISRMLDKQAIADDIDVALDGDVTDTDQQQEVYEFDIDEIFAEISEGQDFTTIEVRVRVL